ncbi:MAG TPA: S9 family peptidase [Phenylobacterium sp.]|jgi:dipeptidyl aminopeptidase/acylaminoacyl peptidase|uniref:S9 family peptidase n=1 Tax=Phenylobacterium sp. TaxID=1871053 RepID=UPI002BC2AD78|nr:S9 family peptidase [Phenylobacterium sp.]HXA37914.1 S9 family peptidase [Phenylobacterium sp.]
MRLALLVSALAIACASSVVAPAAAQVADGPNRMFQGRDIFGLRAAGDPQVRPDGGMIAYVRTTQDIMTDNGRPSIWLIDPATGAQTPLAADDTANLHPVWSPDGTRIAYISAGPGGAQLYVRWMATGHSAKVANLEQAPNAITWSPDGKTLAFVMLTPVPPQPLGAPMAAPPGAKWAEPLKLIERVTYRRDGAGYIRPGYRHLFTVSADGGQPRQITFGKFDEGGQLAYTPDGKGLLFSSNRSKDWERDAGESDIYEVSVANGAITQLTTRKGPDQAPTPSPDGSKIAYVGFDDKGHRGYDNIHLYVMDRDGKNSRVINGDFDRSVGAPVWAADGKSLYVDYADHGITKIARVTLDGKMQEVASGLTDGAEMDRPYTGGSFSVGRNGLVAFTMGDASSPPDIGVVKGGKTVKLTHLNEDLFADKTLGKVEPLAVKSSFDGKPIDAWLVTPPNFDPSKKYPLILEIHGGPFAAYGPVFSTDDQLYAAGGYMVVYANPRGSTSYGDAFANEIDKNYPSHDYDDLMSAVDAAVAKGSVDPNHLYVTGGSGGGALTAWIVGKTARFRAAAAQKPVINWTSEVLTTDGYNFMATSWFGKMPWEDQANYWRRSPLSLVGNVTTPTLVIVGTDDHRTPPSEAEQFFDALQIRGVPTEMIQVPGASHGGLAERPSQAAAKANAIMAWFHRYQ